MRRKMIIHDGWSRCGVHYLYYFAYYVFDDQPKSSLISLAPMANKVNNETTDSTNLGKSRYCRTY